MSRVCGIKTRRVLFTPKSRRLCASFSPLVRGFVLHSLFGIMIRLTDLWRGVFSAVMISPRTKRKRLFVNSQRLPFAKKKSGKGLFHSHGCAKTSALSGVVSGPTSDLTARRRRPCRNALLRLDIGLRATLNETEPPQSSTVKYVYSIYTHTHTLC